MARFTSPLHNIKVAAPCPANWNEMIGNDRVRFCGQCQLNVYNLSGYTEAEAEKVITQTEGRLCVRYYRRADGAVLTQDCPTGLQKLRRKAARRATAALSAALSFLGGLGINAAWRKVEPTLPRVEVNYDLPDFVPLRRVPREPAMMGALVAPPRVEPRPELHNLLYKHENQMRPYPKR